MLGKALQTAAAGNAGGGGLGVEDVFSTWLYDGNNSTQTITNGIDLAGEGGLTWIKIRDTTGSHFLFDTSRGATKDLRSNSASAEGTLSGGLTAFNSTGFSLGSDNAANGNTNTYASWTFRKAEKFFDVVTYTGDGVNGRDIAHNLGSAPGCMFVKRTDTAGSWMVYHRSVVNTDYLVLNTTAAAAGDLNAWRFTDPTSTSFRVGSNVNVNASGGTYVAYLFAHDAGGFGDDGTESVVKCGSYTGTGSNAFIDLGWEPQWLMVKRASSASGNASQDSWHIMNNMVGITPDINSNSSSVKANTSDSENIYGGWGSLAATGFYTGADAKASGVTYIYIAIRRGPMKTPTDATTVFTALATSSGSTGTSRTVGFPADFAFARWRSGTTAMQAVDRLRGMPTSSNANALLTSSTAAEAGYSPYMYDIWNTTAKDGANANLNDMVWQYFRRAPGFFDAVAYAGNSTAGRTVNHNLGVVPELMIVKARSGATNQNWFVYNKFDTATDYLMLNDTAGANPLTSVWNDTEPTSSVFTVGLSTFTNATNYNYIAYLFATCPGVSKVGSYTGTATTQQIDCGFTAGARFVLIKRTDSTGDWYVWDSARGITAGNDPYLLLNSTAAEVTSTDYIDTLSTGFEITSTAPAAINASGGNFIFLAVA